MKSMKKSMFITTILMVVLLIVALSTATFAWYTSNSQVTVSATTVNTASSSAANIEFVWKQGSGVVYNGTSVEFTSGAGIEPMVPAAIPEANAAVSSVSFIGAPVNSTGLNFAAASGSKTPWSQNYVSVAAGSSYSVTESEPVNWSTHYTTYYTRSGASEPYTYSKVPVQAPIPTWAAATYYSLTSSTNDPYTVPSGVTVTELYIANRATSGSTGTLTLTATFDAGTVDRDLADALRLAVFFGNQYKGTLASTACQVSYAANGSWTNGATVATEVIRTDSYLAVAGSTGVELGSINAATETALVIVAWYDGNMLGNPQAGGNATFALNIAAA